MYRCDKCGRPTLFYGITQLLRRWLRWDYCYHCAVGVARTETGARALEFAGIPERFFPRRKDND